MNSKKEPLISSEKLFDMLTSEIFYYFKIQKTQEHLTLLNFYEVKEELDALNACIGDKHLELLTLLRGTHPLFWFSRTTEGYPLIRTGSLLYDLHRQLTRLACHLQRDSHNLSYETGHKWLLEHLAYYFMVEKLEDVEKVWDMFRPAEQSEMIILLTTVGAGIATINWNKVDSFKDYKLSLLSSRVRDLKRHVWSEVTGSLPKEEPKKESMWVRFWKYLRLLCGKMLEEG